MKLLTFGMAFGRTSYPYFSPESRAFLKDEVEDFYAARRGANDGKEISPKVLPTGEASPSFLDQARELEKICDRLNKLAFDSVSAKDNRDVPFPFTTHKMVRYTPSQLRKSRRSRSGARLDADPRGTRMRVFLQRFASVWSEKRNLGLGSSNKAEFGYYLLDPQSSGSIMSLYYDAYISEDYSIAPLLNAMLNSAVTSFSRLALSAESDTADEVFKIAKVSIAKVTPGYFCCFPRLPHTALHSERMVVDITGRTKQALENIADLSLVSSVFCGALETLESSFPALVGTDIVSILALWVTAMACYTQYSFSKNYLVGPSIVVQAATMSPARPARKQYNTAAGSPMHKLKWTPTVSSKVEQTTVYAEQTPPSKTMSHDHYASQNWNGPTTTVKIVDKDIKKEDLNEVLQQRMYERADRRRLSQN